MEKNSCCLPRNWKEPKVILVFLAVILLSAIIVVSILRDSFVRNIQNQVTVTGRGEVSYQPDIALVNLGVKIDKAKTAEEALSKMNEKINNIIKSLKDLGVKEEDITTQNYSLYPQYDYRNGSSQVSGYNANQQIMVKVEGVDKNKSSMEEVINQASQAGINQVLGINFEVSDVNNLKQEARIEAIKDARSKAGELAGAAGIKNLGEVVSWYENLISSPNEQDMLYKSGLGMGAGGESMAPANVPVGNEKIVIEMNVIYEVK